MKRPLPLYESMTHDSSVKGNWVRWVFSAVSRKESPILWLSTLCATYQKKKPRRMTLSNYCRKGPIRTFWHRASFQTSRTLIERPLQFSHGGYATEGGCSSQWHYKSVQLLAYAEDIDIIGRTMPDARPPDRCIQCYRTRVYENEKKFSIGLRSRDWGGHSIMSQMFLAFLLVCLGSLSWWKTQINGITSSAYSSITFCRISTQTCWSMIVSIQWIGPAP